MLRGRLSSVVAAAAALRQSDGAATRGAAKRKLTTATSTCVATRSSGDLRVFLLTYHCTAQLGFLDEFDDLNITTEDINFDEIDGEVARAFRTASCAANAALSPDDLADFQQDEIVKEALEKGVDLKQYSRQIDKDLLGVEVASVADCKCAASKPASRLRVSRVPCALADVREAGKIAGLHTQINECEEILVAMQSMLEGFQENLGGISDEIKHLQDESLSMGIKLRNRESVGKTLHTFLDKVAVSEELIDAICDGVVDDECVVPRSCCSFRLLHTAYTASLDSYVAHLEALSTKIAYTSTRAAKRSGEPAPGFGAAPIAEEEAEEDDDELDIDPSDTHAGRDVIPQLERLRTKAAARCRDFLLSKIAEVKKPKTNVQKVQEYVLLRFKFLMDFCNRHAPDVAGEITQAYVDCMSKMYLSVFRTYHSSLVKHMQTMATKDDLLAVEHTATKSLFGTKSDPASRVDAFALGERGEILEDVEAPPLIAHVVAAEKMKLPYEAIFRSVQRHLLDSATSEYLFTREFFGPKPGKAVFLQVFARTLSQCLENVENHLFNCFDGTALLLMIHVTHDHRLLMQSRRVPVLDSYFDRVNMLLWPRFKVVFDMNLESVKSASTKKVGTIDLQPHFVMKRFAEFSATVQTLHRSLQSRGMSDDMLMHNMTMLRDEVCRLLERMSAEHATPMARCVFLINNFDAFCSLHEERRLSSTDEFAHFDDCLKRQIGLFVEEVLREPFGRLIVFVKQMERGGDGDGGAGGAGGAASRAPPDRAALEALVRDFASSWTLGIEHINNSVMAYFSNFKSGMNILKQALTQLLLYYTRFQELVKSTAPDLTRDLVKIPAILFEIKKYSRSFE